VQSAFVESGLYKGTEWAGIPVQLAPADLINIQMILHKLRPACIVTTSRDDGLIAYLDSIVKPLALEALKIIRVLPAASSRPSLLRVHPVIGHPYHPGTLAKVRQEIGAEEDVLVLFAPQDNDYLPIDSIRAYAQFVSYGSYFIFLGTVFGQPWLAYSKNWYLTAIRKFIEYGAPFKIDTTRDRGILSLCVSGYLQRACDFTTVWRYDPDLDHFDVQELRQ
jgi:cephalosporin hydroxylase